MVYACIFKPRLVYCCVSVSLSWNKGKASFLSSDFLSHFSLSHFSLSL